MLTENDVVEHVARFLGGRGYAIEQALGTSEKGVDIVAVSERDGRRLLIEAKGATSSKEHTARFGKPFTPAQARSHVARAFFEAARVVSKGREDERAALALPRDRYHEGLIAQVARALELLEVSVFWVSSDGTVSWWGEQP